jgi:hypothetical protein
VCVCVCKCVCVCVCASYVHTCVDTYTHTLRSRLNNTLGLSGEVQVQKLRAGEWCVCVCMRELEKKNDVCARGAAPSHRARAHTHTARSLAPLYIYSLPLSPLLCLFSLFFPFHFLLSSSLVSLSLLSLSLALSSPSPCPPPSSSAGWIPLGQNLCRCSPARCSDPFQSPSLPCQPPDVSIRQHTSAYVSICQHALGVVDKHVVVNLSFNMLY